jgi:hypothetical protein
MKLVRFTTADSPNAHFGVVVRDHAVPFAALERREGKPSPYVAGSQPYPNRRARCCPAVGRYASRCRSTIELWDQCAETNGVIVSDTGP